MRTDRLHLTAAIALALGVGWLSPLTSAQQTPVTAEPEVERLRQEVAAIRRDLAAVTLELRQALRELELMREFLASEDAEAQIAAWRTERQALAAERAGLAAERQELEQKRRQLQRVARGQAPPPPELAAREPDPEQVADPPRYELDYTLSYIRTGPDDRTVYVEFGNLLVPASSDPKIDRQNVMVRGTLQNRSADAWRYTFEVRIADRAGRILGRWRYQTPLLEPNELHPFDIKVPVTDATRIDHYQIGNIEGHRPEPVVELREEPRRPR